MNLSKKITLGVFWNFAEQIGRRGIGFFITLFLAKFLLPEAYGMMAMMAMFLSLAANLMDSGFKQALIRLEHVEQKDLDTAFFLNLILGVFSYLILFLIAPFIGNFYSEPKLVYLIRFAGVGVIINSLQIVPTAILNRDLNFKLQVRANLPASLVSGLMAVLFAYYGFGEWALVIQMLCFSLISTVLLFGGQKWRPIGAFSLNSARKMYSFGYKLFLSGLLNIIFSNIYIIVISKFFNSTIAGLYFFANSIVDLIISQVFTSIQTVTYPALASIQSDNCRLKDGYKKVMAVTTFLLFPVMIFLAALARPAFSLFFNERWLPAIPYFQLICFSAIFIPLHALNLNVLNVKGRSDIFLRLEIIKKFLIALVLFISFPYGVYGILIGQIVVSIIVYFPNSYYSSRLINYPVKEQIADILPTLLLTIFCGIIIYWGDFVIDLPIFLKIVTLGGGGVLLFLGIAYFYGNYALNLGFGLIRNGWGKR